MLDVARMLPRSGSSMSDPYYADEFATLYLGDCLEIDAWLDAAVLVTDPPYGVDWTSGFTSYRARGNRMISKTDTIAGDRSTRTRDAVLDLWGDRPAIVFGSWRSPRPAGVEHRLIWHKRGQAPGPVRAAFQSQDEEIYILGSGFERTAPPLRSVIATNEARSIAVAQNGHPTPKPLGLMEVLIRRCPPGIIADPFAGSGSTLVAAKHAGRQTIGVEIDERYCELAARRLAQGVLDLEGIEGP